MTDRRRTEQRDSALAKIAHDVLDLETLETRKMDSLDFHDTAVWSIRQALLDAYTAGFDAGKNPGGGGRAKK